MRFCFETYVLDTSRRELRRSSAQISVEPQVFDVLVYLIQNHDRVVNKDELINAIWNGRIVSDSTVTSRINAVRRALDDSGKEQRLIHTIVGKGIRFVGAVREENHVADDTRSEQPSTERHVDASGLPLPKQKVKFCKAPDGINIAFSAVGMGFPLVKTASWLNHIEYDWQSPIWAPFFHRLASRFEFIRYDGRGNGLSDWNVPEISFEAFERDLEAVMDALQLRRCALFGMSQGAAIAIAYAARFPERVSKLVLYGAYALGRNQRDTSVDSDVAQAILTIMRHGWGDEHSAFMQAFCSLYMPDGSPDEITWFADLQRISTSGENAVRIRVACDEINVLDLLPKVRAPTLVLHCRDDNVVPFDQGRLIATTIPDAHFVALDGKNHVPLPHRPTWERLLAEMETFLAT